MPPLSPKQSSERPDASQARFSETFARRATVPRRGLLPGPRVWATTGALVALAGVGALVMPLLGRIDLSMETAASDRPVAAATPTGRASTPAPSPTGVTQPRPQTSAPSARPPAGSLPGPDYGPGSPAAAPPVGRPQQGRPAAPPAPAHTTKAPAAPGPTVVGTSSGRCIDVTGGKGADGAPLQIRDCSGVDTQHWDFRTDGSVRSMGLCMDVAWGSRTDGAVIQLAVCSGNPAQRFYLSSAGDLVNPQADKCVDVVNNGTASGTKLQLWTCAGTANQKWRLR
ncbi:ricin-type beta-trefoil lectin domain protein [Streptomyces sp. H10-C2]|uniref:RICIN domain-containing protein n=1 Tax=unclassified Streptomyces TaxID=2593676 RepID=UPI0024B9AB00|nr:MULTISPECIES: ricin-type beta-trefoil lectin domain protein [unclassified Streptomyces]MDJ0343352.1 ricin-type beta-trefoil lectin domain protein [Streptomyces sp. PH10-H1]MDJ0371837.1 ricin-type beta-trefoil lectin domain protein [Streptomyces sp. H10-C2]